MFYRHIIKELDGWLKKSNRKPLILRGARQVGKTVAVDLFSRKFEQYICLNLENKKDRELFNHDNTVQELYQAIMLSGNYDSSKSSLLFIDEIQNSPQAIKMLRYFYEELPRVPVIAAGSLFEVMLEKYNYSFPVGRTEQKYMYPLSFLEFINAVGETVACEAYEKVPAEDYALEKLFELFHKYSLVGGMPEVVAEYAEAGDVPGLNDVYESLLLSYNDDVAKYSKSFSANRVIRHCIESATFEAGKRIKFSGFGNSNYKSREIGEALRLLERAMIVSLIYPSTSKSVPIVPDYKKHPKLQFLDTGLVNYFAGLQQYFFKQKDLHSFYKGRIAEHLVMQEFIAHSKNHLRKKCFWVREAKNSNAEIDFLLQYKTMLVPVEVKSGPSGRLRSLHQFIDESEKCDTGIRLYSGPFRMNKLVSPKGKNFTLLNIPYFHTGKVMDYLDWFFFKDN